MFTTPAHLLTDAEIAADAGWYKPGRYTLDTIPDDACPTCAGIRFVWLDKKYLCRECGGTGRRILDETPVSSDQIAA